MERYIQSVESLLREICDKNYESFIAQGSAVAGNNGPYNFTDTPVRNTSHWLIVCSYLWKKTRNDRYQELARVFANYLLQEQSKTVSGAIECMRGKDFDHLNGLIGQAWVIESLVYAYQVFNDAVYLDTAFAIFHSQHFDEEAGLWCRVEITGEDLGLDYTLNHQVWFAAAGLMLLQEREDNGIRKDVFHFLEKLAHTYFDIYLDGLIKHYGTIERPRTFPKSFYIKRKIKDMCIPLKWINPNKFDSKTQEKGYHLFELYGFALIAQYYEDYDLFKTGKFIKALQYGLDMEHMNKLYNIRPILHGKTDGLTRMNRFAYGYNSPAFEYPFVELMFTGKATAETAASILEIQKKLTYDAAAGKFDRFTYDPETLTARAYELVRFCEAYQDSAILA